MRTYETFVEMYRDRKPEASMEEIQAAFEKGMKEEIQEITFSPTRIGCPCGGRGCSFCREPKTRNRAA